MGRAARARRRELPRAARLSPRALRLLPREAGRPPAGRPRRDRAAAADGEGRAPGDAHAGQPLRLASLCGAVRARPHLLDERHHRRAELHPADRAGPRQLGDRLRAQLRGLRDRRGPADRLDLQRRAVRRGRRARRLRPPRPLPHSRRHGQHGAAAAGDRAPASRGRRAHALVRGSSRRVGCGARSGPRDVERRARARRGRAGRRRAGPPREARGPAGARA